MSSSLNRRSGGYSGAFQTGTRKVPYQQIRQMTATQKAYQIWNVANDNRKLRSLAKFGFRQTPLGRAWWLGQIIWDQVEGYARWPWLKTNGWKLQTMCALPLRFTVTGWETRYNAGVYTPLCAQATGLTGDNTLQPGWQGLRIGRKFINPPFLERQDFFQFWRRDPAYPGPNRGLEYGFPDDIVPFIPGRPELAPPYRHVAPPWAPPVRAEPLPPSPFQPPAPPDVKPPPPVRPDMRLIEWNGVEHSVNKMPSVRRPPDRNTREKKFQGASDTVQAIFRRLSRSKEAVTEIQDLLDALFEALPKKTQKKLKGRKTPQGKIKHIYDHWREIDWNTFLDNYMMNQIEDYFMGHLIDSADRAAHKRGATNTVSQGRFWLHRAR